MHPRRIAVALGYEVRWRAPKRLHRALAPGAGEPCRCVKKEDMGKKETAPPMTLKPHAGWYHGSPKRLRMLAACSTVTPVMELAKVFAHKPRNVDIRIRDNTETGEHSVIITHDGSLPGFLYKVGVSDPATQLEEHPGSRAAPGEEMLTEVELPLEFLEELPVHQEYSFTEKRE